MTTFLGQVGPSQGQGINQDWTKTSVIPTSGGGGGCVGVSKGLDLANEISPPTFLTREWLCTDPASGEEAAIPGQDKG